MRAETLLDDTAAQCAEMKRKAMEESREEITKAALLAAEKVLRERTA